MEKLTNRELASIFKLYLMKPIECDRRRGILRGLAGSADWTRFCCKIDYEDARGSWVDINEHRPQLILTPLIEITDEHALELFGIHHKFSTESTYLGQPTFIRKAQALVARGSECGMSTIFFTGPYCNVVPAMFQRVLDWGYDISLWPWGRSAIELGAATTALQ